MRDADIRKNQEVRSLLSQVLPGEIELLERCVREADVFAKCSPWTLGIMNTKLGWSGCQQREREWKTHRVSLHSPYLVRVNSPDEASSSPRGAVYIYRDFAH